MSSVLIHYVKDNRIHRTAGASRHIAKCDTLY